MEASSLKPIVLTCHCGTVLRSAPILQLLVNGRALEVVVPVCPRHTGLVQVVGLVEKSLPTHAPIEMQRTTTFPPARGEIFLGAQGNILVGCPLCSHLMSLDSKVFHVENTELKPSFICSCGLHAWLHWVEPSHTPGT